MAREVKKVLVIKLSALGDFVLALAAMKKIREAHKRAHITLLTTPPFEALAKASPYFNAVETGGRPQGPGEWMALRRALKQARFDRVYDLQTSAASSRIFHLMRPFPPEWSGIALGASLGGLWWTMLGPAADGPASNLWLLIAVSVLAMLLLIWCIQRIQLHRLRKALQKIHNPLV